MIRGRSFQWDAKIFSEAIAVRHCGQNLFKKLETIASVAALPIEPRKGR
jgi:hypothetical protein